MQEQIRKVLAAHGRLARDVAELRDHDDLYAAGMTSFATVNVMLGLEEEFDVEFPEDALRRETFASVSCIQDALVGLGVPAAH